MLLILYGCTQNAKDNTAMIGAKEESVPSSSQEKYNEYLLLMSEEQRSEFLKLETDIERNQFLQFQGLEQQKYLQQHLGQGMGPQQVLELLGKPVIQETELTLQDKKIKWTYFFFNGIRNVQYAVFFEQGQVKKWEIQ